MPYKDKKLANEYSRKYQNARHQRLRLEILDKLGGKCVCCNNDDKRVLQIDHIVEILRGKNKLPRSSSWTLISRIYRNIEDLTNIQLLCANCHMIKTVQSQRARDHVPSASG
jgi:5-methylcytosine-specific restriction endonuclease McrA